MQARVHTHQHAYSLLLSELLPEQRRALGPLGSLRFTGMTLDSRKISAGDLFIACQGHEHNGLDYAAEAIKRGAVAILVNEQQRFAAQDFAVPVLVVRDLEQRLGELGNRFYLTPSQQLHMVGVTGTNGKTSCSHFIAQALSALNRDVAVLGTIGNGFLNKLQTSSHTTPDALSLQQQLAEFRDQGADQVAMEVSSHALDQHRVNGTHFDQVVFTNLSRDHLDYHGNMARYGSAKSRLFTEFGANQAIINLDDEYAETLLQGLPVELEVIGYGRTPSPLAQTYGIEQLWLENVRLSDTGLQLQVQTPWGLITANTRIFGEFNLYNLMATIAVLGGQQIPDSVIERVLPELHGVPGRMQPVVIGEPQPRVVVDYAHTPDALEQALVALRPHCQGRLWCVFGCGGDRDMGKRPQMAAVAERLAELLVVTSDNPRSEEPEQIIRDILAGFSGAAQPVVKVDRYEAIAHAIQCAAIEDLVLLAGKGHEEYQEVQGSRLSFSDVEVAKTLLKSRQQKGERQQQTSRAPRQSSSRGNRDA